MIVQIHSLSSIHTDFASFFLRLFFFRYVMVIGPVIYRNMKTGKTNLGVETKTEGSKCTFLFFFWRGSRKTLYSSTMQQFPVLNTIKNLELLATKSLSPH